MLDARGRPGRYTPTARRGTEPGSSGFGSGCDTPASGGSSGRAARASRRASTVAWSSSISRSLKKTAMPAKSLSLLTRPLSHVPADKASAAAWGVSPGTGSGPHRTQSSEKASSAHSGIGQSPRSCCRSANSPCSSATSFLKAGTSLSAKERTSLPIRFSLASTPGSCAPGLRRRSSRRSMDCARVSPPGAPQAAARANTSARRCLRDSPTSSASQKTSAGSGARKTRLRGSRASRSFSVPRGS